MYKIRTIARREDIIEGNRAEISVYPWGGDYRPEAWAELCLLQGEGFLLRMTCLEKEPRSVITEQNSGVCRDSCMEFFANFRPEKAGTGYLNFECNSIGSLLCCYGPDRYERKTVVELSCAHPKAVPFRQEAAWGYTLLIPFSLLHRLYGEREYGPGTVIRGNFYKCGDDTDVPHYGCYAPVTADHPDFHRPECFTGMEIV